MECFAGRAAELCSTPLAGFMEFARRTRFLIRYGETELEEGRRAASDLGL